MSAETMTKHSTRTSPKTMPKKRSKVLHVSWEHDYEAALAMGIREVPSICGRKWGYVHESDPDVQPWELPGGEIVITGACARTCKLCLRIMRAAARREFAR